MPAVYEPFPGFAEWSAGLQEPPFLSRFAELLRTLRASADTKTLARAETRIRDYAAIQTGAVEGLYDISRGATIAIAAQAAVITAAEAQLGTQSARVIEDQIAAFEYVLDAVTRRVPVTQIWIRQLHEVLCAHQETYRVLTAVGSDLVIQDRLLPRGAYKEEPNSPTRPDGTVHAYAPVDAVGPEMQRLVDELASREFARAAPVLQAAFAHHALTCIHPFADGNGRVARALASVYLYREPGVPFLLFTDQKAEYLAALEAADLGDRRPLVSFTAECVREAIEEVQTALSEPDPDSPVAALEHLRSSLTTPIGGLTPRELDAVVAEVEQLMHDALDNQIASLVAPPDLSVAMSRTNRGTSADAPSPGYRLAMPTGMLSSMTLYLSPSGARLTVSLVCEAAMSSDLAYEVLVRAAVEPGGSVPVTQHLAQPFGARVSDVRPRVTPRLRNRAEAWATALLASSIETLASTLA